jgi:ribose 5-phosphate isomerase A
MAVDTTPMKESAARAALAYVVPGTVIGVGSGSTAAAFIHALGAANITLAGAVPSSLATGRLLAQAGVRVIEPTEVCALPLYVDGADEADPALRLIKGGGGALTREKIVASMAERFVCIVDETKLVPGLGAFPLAIEVLPAALARVELHMRVLGGDPHLREEFVTDNGNWILDVAGLDFGNPGQLEAMLDGIAGIVAHGLFARRPADTLIVGLQVGGSREIVAAS